MSKLVEKEKLVLNSTEIVGTHDDKDIKSEVDVVYQRITYFDGGEKMIMKSSRGVEERGTKVGRK